MASKPSHYEPSAPPFPPTPYETQPLVHAPSSPTFPGAHGDITSYQQYITPPPPAYGVPVPGWQHQYEDSRGEWSTDLCHCLADIPVCCLACVCPCILFGKIAEEVDDGTTSCFAATVIWYVLQQFTSCGCIYSCGYRAKLRARYRLPAKPLPDCMVHWLCWPCAFCQEYRELRIRRNTQSQTPPPWFARPAVISPPHQSMTY